MKLVILEGCVKRVFRLDCLHPGRGLGYMRQR